MKNITNLALEGGGAKGVAHIGALKALKEFNLLNKIEHIAGTSAGSIVAFLVAVGYSYEEINDIMFSLNMDSLLEYSPSYIKNPPFDFKKESISSMAWEMAKEWFYGEKNSPKYKYIKMILDVIFCKRGVCSGNLFHNWVVKMIENSPIAKSKGLKGLMTFSQLVNHGGKDLHIFTSSTYREKVIDCCAKNTPDLEIALAVRASMSIPFYFEPVSLPGIDDLEMDGGIYDNLPLTFMDKLGLGDQTLGLSLNATKNIAPQLPSGVGLDFYLPAGEQLIDDVLNTQVQAYHLNEYLNKRIAYIELPAGVSTFSFNMTSQVKQECIDAGYKAVVDYFNKNNN